MAVGVRIVTSGALFRLGGGPIAHAIEEAIIDIVARGEELVKDQLKPGHGLVTGHYRRSIHGELDNSRHGTIHDSEVVYGPWLEGTSSRNASTRFKGYSMFRRARQQLDREKNDIVSRQMRKAVGRLNGG